MNLIHRKCPKSGKENLAWRLRLTESAQAYLAELRSRRPDGFVDFEVIGSLPNEVQYRIRGPDGTYTWDPRTGLCRHRRRPKISGRACSAPNVALNSMAVAGPDRCRARLDGSAVQVNAELQIL